MSPHATVVLDAAVGDGVPYTDTALDLRKKATNAVKPPRTVQVGLGVVAV